MTRAAIGVLACLLAGGVAQADVKSSGGPYVLDWYTIDGGGGTSSGGAYTLSGTIGQHDASTPLTGGAYTLGPGFWYGAGTTCAADIDGDGLLTFGDVSAFLTFFNGGNPAADIDGDGLLTFGDVSLFISLFNAGC
jgi:hypothetical protein